MGVLKPVKVVGSSDISSSNLVAGRLSSQLQPAFCIRGMGYKNSPYSISYILKKDCQVGPFSFAFPNGTSFVGSDFRSLLRTFFRTDYRSILTSHQAMNSRRFILSLGFRFNRTRFQWHPILLSLWIECRLITVTNIETTYTRVSTKETVVMENNKTCGALSPGGTGIKRTRQ